MVGQRKGPFQQSTEKATVHSFAVGPGAGEEEGAIVFAGGVEVVEGWKEERACCQ